MILKNTSAYIDVNPAFLTVPSNREIARLPRHRSVCRERSTTRMIDVVFSRRPLRSPQEGL
jgi:hypothetical protein